jgi:hypothetical protein
MNNDPLPTALRHLKKSRRFCNGARWVGILDAASIIAVAISTRMTKRMRFGRLVNSSAALGSGAEWRGRPIGSLLPI